MEIVSLSGGIGNQMFQYAFLLAKQKRNQKIKFTSSFFKYFANVHNGFELNRVFTLSSNNENNNFFTSKIIWVASKIAILKNRKGYYKTIVFFLSIIKALFIVFEEREGVYNAKALKKRKGFILYWGYWQSENYFSSIRTDILKSFTFDQMMMSDKSASALSLIEKTNSISVHIRRGDYLHSDNLILFGNICTTEYYSNAINTAKEKIKDPVFFIFSNDIKWVKENLQIPDSYYIDWNEKEDSWQDMFLMSKCKHNIIANSTFSWWGAWLNQNTQKIVISPDHFYNGIDAPDLIPDSWIKIKTG